MCDTISTCNVHCTKMDISLASFLARRLSYYLAKLLIATKDIYYIIYKDIIHADKFHKCPKLTHKIFQINTPASQYCIYL